MLRLFEFALFFKGAVFPWKGIPLRRLPATGRTGLPRYAPCAGRTYRYGTGRCRHRWYRAVDFSYWVHDTKTVGSAAIRARIDAALQQYIKWQSAKLGRDINPSYLISLLMQTGVKRVEIREPVFTSLRDGTLALGWEYEYPETVPQLAEAGTVSIVNGGYEDE